MICCKRDEIFEMGFGFVRRGVKGFRSKVFEALYRAFRRGNYRFILCPLSGHIAGPAHPLSG